MIGWEGVYHPGMRESMKREEQRRGAENAKDCRVGLFAKVFVHSPMPAVIPAKAGIQYAGLACFAADWIPAFAGMTAQILFFFVKIGGSRRERLLVKQDRSASLRVLRAFALMFAVMCLPASAAWACNSGTVRDAGFSGPRDTYRLCVFAPAADAELKTAYTRIDAWLKGRGPEFNVQAEWVDSSAPDLDWGKYGMTSEPPKLPVSVLSGFSGQLRRSFVVTHWDPAPTNEDLDAFFGSPTLAEAKKQLVEIWAAVLYAPQAAPNPEIEKTVSEWSKKNPPGVQFLSLDRKDPKEKLLAELGEISPESPDWAGILFARGKLKAPMLRGGDLTVDNLTRQLTELTEKCTCLQESSVFGLDLPMTWEKPLDDRFSALESKAAGYTEITFEKQADAMAKNVEPARPRLLIAILVPLAVAVALALGSAVYFVWRNRRAGRG